MKSRDTFELFTIEATFSLNHMIVNIILTEFLLFE